MLTVYAEWLTINLKHEKSRIFDSSKVRDFFFPKERKIAIIVFMFNQNSKYPYEKYFPSYPFSVKF